IRKTAKILVVDDDDSIRKILLDFFSSSDRSYLIDEAANGIEACIKLGSYHPDILILDINMPEMDGLEVCRIIKSAPELSDICVIISTGFPDHPKLKQISELGFEDVIYKPFNLKDLMKKIDNILIK
ncbi:response regulator, partial [Thermodesulfobacteriota bacterium]